MKRTKLLAIGTGVLTITSFLIRTIDVSFTVFLTNKIGESAVGLFFLITAVYSMAVTFSSGGAFLASSRLTAEKENKKGIINICLIYSLILGLVFSFLLFSFSDIISQYWIKDENALVPLKILSFSLPFVSMSSVLGGYFTAKKKVLAYSFIELFQDIIYISFCTFLLSNPLKNEIGYSCSAIVFSLSLSFALSFFVSFIFYKIDKNAKEETKENLKDNIKDLMHIALPDALGSSARSILLTLEHLLIPIGFRKSGQSDESSMATYGIIHAMALPLVLYPAAVLTSLSQLLIPEFAKLKKQNKIDKIEFGAEKTLKLTFIFALGVAGIIYSFADELSYLIYRNEDCAAYLKMLSVLIPIMYTDTSVDAVLKGLDQQKYSMRYNIIDSLLCVVLVYTLIPRYCTKGYIFVLFSSEILNFYLSFSRLLKVCKIKIDIKNTVLKPLISIISAVFICKFLMQKPIEEKLILALSIIFMFCIYTIILFVLSSFKDDDLELIKSIFSKD